MGSITTGIGLISGLDTANLISSLIAIESRPKSLLQNQVASLQAQQAALLDINSRLLGLMSSAEAFRKDTVFRSSLATSSDETVLTGTTTSAAQPGSYQFIVKQLVATSQKLTGGFADKDSTPLGLETLEFELGNGGVAPDTDIADLNGGNGIDRGSIKLTDSSSTVTVDLGDVTTINEVLNRINDNGVIDVTALVDGDHLVVVHNDSEALTIADGAGDTTATDLGIAGTGLVITGTDINYLGSTTAIESLNDGNGVLIKSNVADFEITAADGSIFQIDLGRIDQPIDSDTELSQLNNGAGVTFDGDTDTADIKFVVRDGTEYEVDLSGLTTVGGLINRIQQETSNDVTVTIVGGEQLLLTDATAGSDTFRVEGAGTTGDAAAEDLGILTEDGDADGVITGSIIPYLVDQPQAITITDVIDRINDAEDTLEVANGGRIVASIAADGVSLQIVDTTGVGTTTVASTASNPFAAAALGIEGSTTGGTISGGRILAGLNSVLVDNLNGGQGLAQSVTTSTLLSELFFGRGITTNGDSGSADISVQARNGSTYEIEVDGLETVQDLIDAFATTTGGDVTLALNGQAFEATNNALGLGNFVVKDLNGATAASELEITGDLTPLDGDTITGVDFSSTTLDITNRLGTLTSVDLSSAESLSDVLNLINGAGASVTAAINNAGNGIRITDQTGSTTSNLKLEGVVANALGIQADAAADTVEGTNIQHRYVDEASRLEDLNYGRGIGTGSFRITDGLGQSAVVDIGGSETTLHDVIQEINSKGLAVNARVNDNGDGLLIEDTTTEPSPAVVKLKVESVTGSVASNLNILGVSATVGGDIDGTYEQSISVTAADTLASIAEKINDAGIPVTATVINTGSGPTPFRLSLTSGISGRDGELFIDTDGFDLGLTTITTGADAKVFFGAESAEDGFLITSGSNTVSGLIEGVTIDLHTTSDTAVTLTVDRDQETIVAAVDQFVTNFNSVVGGIDQYDFFDVETEQRGILLGNPTTSRVRAALFRTLQEPAENVGGSLRFLSQAGITIGDNGQLSFDQQKFRDLLASDPASLEALFAAFESTATPDVEIAPDVFITADPTVLSQGFGDIFKDLTDRFTDSLNGVVTLARQAMDDRIELLNDRIADMDVRLERRRQQLEREFAAMELALSRLQGQGNALQSLAANIALSQSAGAG